MTTAPTARPDVASMVASSAMASEIWAATTARQRKTALDAVADHLDAHAEQLVPLAMAESHLTEARLRGELKRTTFQLRLFGEVLQEGSFLDARIDHADPGWGMGPRPDLRRVLEPVGPVVVFAASNFPFAFSVAGGDTASALAAGCSVILKAHSGHPQLSALTGRLVIEALASAGAPEGLFSLVFEEDDGRTALTDPRVKAGSFTGSIAGGRALFDLAAGRPEPIPFFGEMGSVNPVFITEAAAGRRADEIVGGLVASFTLGAGQFCTKPGVVFVPRTSEIRDRLRDSLMPPAVPLLNERIEAGYTAGLNKLIDHQAVEVVAADDDAGRSPLAPTVLATSLAAVRNDPEGLLTECFGPTVLLVEYSAESELLEAARLIPGQLTATIVGEEDDPIVPELLPLLARKAGRLLWNQWPTGVSVSYAQQHGGPYPATTASASTSVGTGAISRFLRPVAYQGFPDAMLPSVLRDEDTVGIPRRVDGVLTVAAPSPTELGS